MNEHTHPTPLTQAPREVIPLVDNIPPEMRQAGRWVLWRYEERRGKRTKVPYTTSGHQAKTTDARTWSDLEACLDRLRGGGFDGLGFVLGDGYGGIDLDAAINPETGEVSELAQEMMRRYPSYTELSPSGTGLHIIVKTKAGPGYREGDLEAYSQGRYFTVTGEVYGANRSELRRHDLSAFGAKTANAPVTRTASTVGMVDDDLLKRAFAAKNGYKVERLYRGSTSGYRSRSEADLALASMLAFWTGADVERLETLMRGSSLAREKWDAQCFADGRTYLEATLEKASRRDVVYSGDLAGSGADISGFMGLLDPSRSEWAGRTGFSRLRIYKTLLKFSTKHGLNTDLGVEVSASLRHIALKAGVTLKTLVGQLSVLRGDGLLVSSKGRKSNRHLLPYPQLRGGDKTTSHTTTVETYDLLSSPPTPLRAGGGKAGKRVGPYGEQLAYLLAKHGPLKTSQLAKLCNRDARSVRRKLSQMADEWELVQRCADDAWKLVESLEVTCQKAADYDGSRRAMERDERKYQQQRERRAEVIAELKQRRHRGLRRRYRPAPRPLGAQPQQVLRL